MGTKPSIKKKKNKENKLWKILFLSEYLLDISSYFLS